MRYSHRIDGSGKDATGWLQIPFRIPFMTMQIEIMTWSSIISCTTRCLRMRTEMIHDVMRTEIRMGTNPVKCFLWNAHWIWNRSRMGLLNSENEDVTNVISESSNSYTSLKSNSFDGNGVHLGHERCHLHPPPLISHTINTSLYFPFHVEACSFSVFSNTTKSVT